MSAAPDGLPEPLPGFAERALEVRTLVLRERGQWVVYLDVMFWQETRRFRIQAYRNERLARLAAETIRRIADRDLPAPPTGL